VWENLWELVYEHLRGCGWSGGWSGTWEQACEYERGSGRIDTAQ
jgi:hypothetical protein